MQDPNFVEEYNGMKVKCSNCGEYGVVMIQERAKVLEFYCGYCSDKVNQLDDIDSYASDVEDAMETLSNAVAYLKSLLG